MGDRERREITLTRVQVLGGEGKVVPKRKCPALESSSAVTGLEGPGELHPQIRQTAVDGNSTISSKQGRAFYF